MSERRPSRSQPEPPVTDEDDGRYEAEGMISAYGLFRLLLILLALWTIFEGFALATGAFSAVDANSDRTAERMLGGLMIVLGGIYAVLAWRREQYRLLLWVPFAAQAAIVLPLLFSWDFDRLLLLVISSIFLVLMLYVWWRSRGMAPEVEEDEDPWDEGAFEDLADSAEPPARRPAHATTPPAAGDSAQRTASRPPPRFRRRDG